MDALGAHRQRHLAHFQRKTDVVGHGHGGVERIALEHHGNVALGRCHADHVTSADAQGAFGGLFQTGNDVEQGGLAAARGTHQDQEFAGIDGDVDFLEHLNGGSTFAEDLADARDFKG